MFTVQSYHLVIYNKVKQTRNNTKIEYAIKMQDKCTHRASDLNACTQNRQHNLIQITPKWGWRRESAEI